MRLKNTPLHELWESFSINLIDFDDRFKEHYFEEEQYLKSLLRSYIKRISHIDSISIKNIKTKPIVDILI